MENQTLNIEDIEFAERLQPSCSRCGLPTRLVAGDGVIWLDCIDYVDAPALRKMLTREFGHTHRVILEQAVSINA